jgi:HD-GYP domain-containing protein (c-di-GMP phosphodiesterase class II)
MQTSTALEGGGVSPRRGFSDDYVFGICGTEVAPPQRLVLSAVEALEDKDKFLLGHARQVTAYSVAIGCRMGLTPERLALLSRAAFLHDIGYVDVPGRVLNKRSELDDGEWAVMRAHAAKGADMLARVEGYAEVAEIVRAHHEHFDGSGYPRGLKGAEIPLESRIILVADSYDAMTNQRPFRPACGHEPAVRLLTRHRGTWFDPDVVNAFAGIEPLDTLRIGTRPGLWARTLMEDGDADLRTAPFNDLVRVVEVEPVLAAAVLERVNAACGEEESVVDLRVAASRLGDVALRGLFREHGSRLSPWVGLDAEWEHSVRTALAARLLARRSGLMEEGEAYALGLLHDLGTFVLSSYYHDETAGLLLVPERKRLCRELHEFGADHALVGAWALAECKLPWRLRAAVMSHHDWARVSRPETALLHAAHVVAGAGPEWRREAAESVRAVEAVTLGMRSSDLAQVHADVVARMEGVYAFRRS